MSTQGQLQYTVLLKTKYNSYREAMKFLGNLQFALKCPSDELITLLLRMNVLIIINCQLVKQISLN